MVKASCFWLRGRRSGRWKGRGELPGEERKKALIEKAKADYEEAVNKYNAAVDEYDRARETYIKARNNYYKLVGDVPGRCSSGMIDDIWKKLFEEYFWEEVSAFTKFTIK